MTFLRSSHLVVSLLCSFTFACGSSGGGQDDPGGSDPSGSGGAGAGVDTGGDSNAGDDSNNGGNPGNGGDTGAGGNPTSNLTPIFRMDCEDAPLDCGWGFVPEASPFYTMTHIEDGGPHGEDVVEFEQTPQPPGSPQMQYYLGWTTGLEVATQGVTRYARLWFKPITPIVWHGTGDVWGDKFFMLGDPSPEDTRVICNLRDDYGVGSGNDMLVNCARNIDGAPSKADGATLVANQWNFLQIEIRSSSTNDAEDARIAMWYNNNDYAVPTSQSTGGFVLRTYGWGAISLGRFAGTLLAHDGSVRYQLGGFEFDDEFDPNWAR